MSEHKIPIPSMLYNAAVGGHVTNSQQIIDEDYNLEQKDINKETLGVPYNASNPNGMGKIVLKKNDNFKQIVESQIDGNTIFVIKYDFTLTDNVTIPTNCVLKFDGGSLNGNTIYFNNTTIEGNAKIYTNIALNSSIKGEIFVSWFDENSNDSTQCLYRVKQLLEGSNGNVVNFEPKKTYNLLNKERYFFTLKSNTIINGCNAIIKIMDGSNTTTFTWLDLFYVPPYVTNIKIQNLNLNCNGENNVVNYKEGKDYENNGLIRCYSTMPNESKNVIISNCTISNSLGGRAIFLQHVNDIIISNCRFIDIGPVDGAGLMGDHSTIMGIGKRWQIIGNYLYNNEIHKQGTGLDLGCSDSIIENNTVIHSCTAMNLAAESEYNCENNIVRNNKFYDSWKYALRFWTIGNVGLYNNTIDNNIIKFIARTEGPGACRGFMFGDDITNICDGVYITNNVFKSDLTTSLQNSYETFISICSVIESSEIKNIVIKNNTFKNSSSSAIEIKSILSHNITIESNIIVDSSLSSEYAAIDITPPVSGRSYNINICNNNISKINSNLEYGIEIASRNVYNVNICYNIIDTSYYTGIRVVSNGITFNTSDNRIAREYIHVEHVTSKRCTGSVTNIKCDQSSFLHDPHTGCTYHAPLYNIGAWSWEVMTDDKYPTSAVASPPIKGCVIKAATSKQVELGAIGYIYDGNNWNKFGYINLSAS